MTLSTYIECLKDLYNQYGDLPLIYASDSEGNSYRKVHYEPDGQFACDLSKSDIELEDEFEIPNCILIN